MASLLLNSVNASVPTSEINFKNCPNVNNYEKIVKIGQGTFGFVFIILLGLFSIIIKQS